MKENTDADTEVDWNDKTEIRQQITKSKKQMSELETDLQEFINNICRNREYYTKEEMWKQYRRFTEKIHRSKARFSTMNDYYNKHTKKITELLKAFMKPMCNDCCRKVADAINDLEEDYNF